MAGRTQYFRVKEVLKRLDGQIKTISELKIYVKMHLSSDEKRALIYLKLMQETNLIKEIEAGRFLITSVADNP